MILLRLVLPSIYMGDGEKGPALSLRDLFERFHLETR